MKTKELVLAFMPTLLLLLAIGCSNKNVQPELLIDEPNLSDEFGGYSTASESPGFGDDQLLDEAYASDDEYDDPMLSDAAVTEFTSDPQAGLYHLRIVWGQLRFDSSMTNPTDWSGSLSITRGAEIIRRVINFELGQDYIVPRSDRKLIEWVSQTTLHNDGIAVDLLVPPVKPVLDTTEIEVTDSAGNTVIIIVVDTTWPVVEPVTVSFNTGPYSTTFDLDELVSLDTIVFLEDSNAVAFHAFKLDGLPCPRGFLAGRWGFDDSTSGLFTGVWLNRAGLVVGYSRGHFGQRENGEKVFFGKWVSREGRFEGFIKGHWEFDDISMTVDSSAATSGYFRGQIFSEERLQIGYLAGHFGSVESENDAIGGFLQGRWKISCSDESFSNIDTDNDDGLTTDFR